MKNEISKFNYVVVFLLLSVMGCKKNEMASGYAKSSSITKNTLTPTVFDWETADYMPTPAGTTILVPWGSGSNQSFPLIYNTDIKKADGWELVYNTFNTDRFIQPYYFVLYNRYRGLLRAYFYLNPGASIPSSNISYSLVQKVASSPVGVFNYSAAEIADLKYTSLTSTIVQPYKTNATGTWYAAEFEMAYDPDISTKDAANNWMVFEVNSINTSNITINGTSQGGITGTVVQPTPAAGLFGTLEKGALQIGSYAAISSLKLTSTVGKSLTDALKSGSEGGFKGILNGIFGGNGGQTTQYVNLTTSANYQFAGTSSSIYQIASPSMVIPGSKNQDNVADYSPLYKKALGIISLSSYPMANISIPEGGAEFLVTYPEWSTYTIDKNSYVVKFNPDIINSSSDGAQIQNLKSNFVCPTSYYLTNNPLGTMGSNNGVSTEVIGGIPYVAIDLNVRDYPIMLNLNPNNIGGDAYSQMLTPGQSLPNAYLRISFDVVPNNGAAKSTIVKTFRIITSHNEYDYLAV